MKPLLEQHPNVILSGFCDEICERKDIDVQFSVMSALGFEYVTLRFLNLGAGIKNISALSLEDSRQISRRLSDYGLKVAALGSPIGKVKLVDQNDGTTNVFRDSFEYLHLEVNRIIDLALAFQTRLVRGFSFYHPKGSDPKIYLSDAAERLAEIARKFAAENLVLGLEVEANLIGQNADLLVELLEQIANPAVVLIFDGANLVTQGYSRAEVLRQWNLMKPYVGAIHVKDYRRQPGRSGEWVDEDKLTRFVTVGQGDACYPEILQSLKYDWSVLSPRMHIVGLPGLLLDLEPHLAGGGQFGGYSSARGFGAAFRALCNLLSEQGIAYRLRGFEHQ